MMWSSKKRELQHSGGLLFLLYFLITYLLSFGMDVFFVGECDSFLQFGNSGCIVSNFKKNSWNIGEKFSSLSMRTTPLLHGRVLFLRPFKKIHMTLCFHHSFFSNVNDDWHRSLSWLTLNKKSVLFWPRPLDPTLSKYALIMKMKKWWLKCLQKN